MGDFIAANLFMLGYTFQKGFVPLTLAAIERAIELNGVAVDTNKRSFAWGRLAAHDRAQVEALVRGTLRDDPVPEPQNLDAQNLDAIVENRAAFLKSYQNAAYAQRYRNTVRTVRVAEAKLTRGFSGLAEAVARNLFTLMAYKDEYEVARLYTDGAFIKSCSCSSMAISPWTIIWRRRSWRDAIRRPANRRNALSAPGCAMCSSF